MVFGGFAHKGIVQSGSVSFVPTNIAGCVLWLRADQGVTESGGAVSQWNDLSGNGNHATQTSGTNKPTYSSSSGPGSKPGITFDGSSDYLTCNGIVSTFGTDLPFTIVVSFKTSATAAKAVLMVGKSSGSTPRIVSYLPVGATQVRCDRADDSNSSQNVAFTTTVNDNTWRGIQHISSGTTVSYRNNNTTFGAQAQNVGTATPNIATIGATRNSGFPSGVEFWSGTMWEMIVYNHQLDSTESNLVYNYQVAQGGAA